MQLFPTQRWRELSSSRKKKQRRSERQRERFVCRRARARARVCCARVRVCVSRAKELCVLFVWLEMDAPRAVCPVSGRGRRAGGARASFSRSPRRQRRPSPEVARPRRRRLPPTDGSDLHFVLCNSVVSSPIQTINSSIDSHGSWLSRTLSVVTRLETRLHQSYNTNGIANRGLSSDVERRLPRARPARARARRARSPRPRPTEREREREREKRGLETGVCGRGAFFSQRALFHARVRVSPRLS